MRGIEVVRASPDGESSVLQVLRAAKAESLIVVWIVAVIAGLV